MKTTRTTKAKAITIHAKPSPPSSLELVSSQVECVNGIHEGISALSLALEEIEGQYAVFSSEAVTEYARAAIVDKLGAYSKIQCEHIDKLFDRIKALGPAKAA